jgi:hypothetical protein
MGWGGAPDGIYHYQLGAVPSDFMWLRFNEMRTWKQQQQNVNSSTL